MPHRPRATDRRRSDSTSVVKGRRERWPFFVLVSRRPPVPSSMRPGPAAMLPGRPATHERAVSRNWPRVTVRRCEAVHRRWCLLGFVLLRIQSRAVLSASPTDEELDHFSPAQPA